MRNAETVLATIHTRGQRGLPIRDLYRMLFIPDLYLRAYHKLYPNRGALTPGATPETVDGMSLAKIHQLIDDVRHERHRWTPVRRVYIAKRNGRLRPLGIPSWKDKLLQEVIRTILEAYYEPQFSPLSHGFRPQRGCHTALQTIQSTWKGTRWFIEGDLASYFDTINHEVLLRILSEQLHDNRFLRLIRHLLQAGYLEDWKHHQTLSGAPQGSIVSPILSNIYLHKLDQYVESTLIPAYTRGTRRRTNSAYKALSRQITKLHQNGQRREARRLRTQRQHLPALDTHDPTYRRLRYVRYADDFLLGFAGPRHEAEAIKQAIAAFVQSELGLELSADKTLITHASTSKARFLGYELVSQHNDSRHDNRHQRSINGAIGLRVPTDVIQRKCAQYCYRDKPVHRSPLIFETDFSIVARYQAEYRGIVQYYQLALNVSHFWQLHWVMKTSLLKTLAAKHQTSRTAMARKYHTIIQAPDGTSHSCLQVRVERPDKPPLTAQFGGLSLKRQPWAVLNDQPSPPPQFPRSELLQRLQADECELCSSRQDVEVHHIRKLADLKGRDGSARPTWVRVMAMRQRKTLVVCHACHAAIHAGRPTRRRDTE
jgi:group II intron reverse transcriptase/maturase